MHDLEALQGSWQLELQATDGQVVPLETVRRTRLIIDGNRVSALIDGKPDGAICTIALDPSTGPKEWDRIVEYRGKKDLQKCIYELRGATLRLAVPSDFSERPQAFDQRGVTIQVYRRLKR